MPCRKMWHANFYHEYMSEVHPDTNPLDSRQLRAFVTLARTGSFTQTGRELTVTQSAVSHAMKALETDIGCRLFDRLGKKVHLTPAGEHFLHHAQRIVGAMTQARQTMEQLENWGQTRLRLGASPTPCQHVLPEVFRELRRQFPHIMLTVDPCDSLHAKTLLETKRIDLAFTLQPEGTEALHFEGLFSDELVFVVSPEHPWASARSVLRETIALQNFVLSNRGSRTYRMIEGYFRHEEISLTVVAELGSTDAIKQFVKLGLGISILAPWVARRELAEGSLIALPLGKRKLKRAWGVVHQPDHQRTLAQESFVRLCREQCASLSP